MSKYAATEIFSRRFVFYHHLLSSTTTLQHTKCNYTRILTVHYTTIHYTALPYTNPLKAGVIINSVKLSSRKEMPTNPFLAYRNFFKPHHIVTHMSVIVNLLAVSRPKHLTGCALSPRHQDTLVSF